MKTLPVKFTMPVLFALLLAGGGIITATAHAMPFGGPDGKPRCEARQSQDFQSFRLERHAQKMGALKAKLNLAPAQEAAWNDFAKALEPDMRMAGMDKQAMREDFQTLNTVERLGKMQALSESRRARMSERVEAIKAFYTRLSPTQQKVFDQEMDAWHQQRMHQRRYQS